MHMPTHTLPQSSHSLWVHISTWQTCWNLDLEACPLLKRQIHLVMDGLTWLKCEGSRSTDVWVPTKCQDLCWIPDSFAVSAASTIWNQSFDSTLVWTSRSHISFYSTTHKGNSSLSWRLGSSWPQSSLEYKADKKFPTPDINTRNLKKKKALQKSYGM